MQGTIEAIFIASKGGKPMKSVNTAEAVENKGLRGDRYMERTGYWTNVDECEVTLINAEDLDAIERDTGISVNKGEHRRNIIVRGLDVNQLLGQEFVIGDAVMVGVRPRPPCSYIESITEPGMTRALARVGGICASVRKAGTFGLSDTIVIV